MTNLFKPKVNLVQAATPGFGGGGLIGNASSGAGVVTPTQERTDVVGGLSSAGETAANTYRDLYNTVRPGFNDLLSSRLATFNDAARSAIGDLSQNLSSRRILGSSFGQDTLTRARSELSRQRDAIVADNFLKSLEAQQQLTANQFQARIQQFQPRLNELNLEAGLAADLGNAASKALNDAAQFNARNQNAANAAGLNSLGSLLGTGLGFAKSFLPTGGFSSMFGSGGGNVSAGSYGGVPYPIFG